jgi:hypothetical protein
MGAPALKRLRRGFGLERVPEDCGAPLMRGFYGEIRTTLITARRERGGYAYSWETRVKSTRRLFLPGALATLVVLAACTPVQDSPPPPTPPPTPTAVPVTVNLEDVGAVVVASPASGPGNSDQIYVVTFDASEIVERVMPAVVTVINEQRFGEGTSSLASASNVSRARQPSPRRCSRNRPETLSP